MFVGVSMNYDKKIVFFIGPSSSGKDTFFKKVKDIYQIERIVPLTTRDKRLGEQEGEEYHFISQEQMDLLNIKNLLIERRTYNTFHGRWDYATGKEGIDLERNHYIYPAVWTIYQSFLKHYPKKNLVPVYFQLDDGIRLQRALDREKEGNCRYAEMCRRYLADEQDFSREMLTLHKPFIIDNNGSIEETMDQLDDILVRKLGVYPRKK